MGSFEIGAFQGEDFIQATLILFLGEEAGVEELDDEILGEVG